MRFMYLFQISEPNQKSAPGREARGVSAGGSYGNGALFYFKGKKTFLNALFFALTLFAELLLFHIQV